MRHGHRIGNSCARATGSPLEVDDFCASSGLLAAHRLEVRGRRLLLKVHVGSNAVGLALKELLFVLFGVDDRSVEACHVLLVEDKAAKGLSVLFPLL